MTRTFRCVRRVQLLCCLTLLGLGVMSLGALGQQRVGVNSAVNPEAMGIPPGGLQRRLVLGQDVVFNERITTEAAGQTQVLFVDESTLSVGPNANMVIDQFVYDPNAGTGKLAASLGRGIFRFVGGKISKQDNAVTMRTPTATIGIRGGVMLVRVRTDCSSGAWPLGVRGCNALQVIFVYGKGVTITGLNGVSRRSSGPVSRSRLLSPGLRHPTPARPRPATLGRCWPNSMAVPAAMAAPRPCRPMSWSRIAVSPIRPEPMPSPVFSHPARIRQCGRPCHRRPTRPAPTRHGLRRPFSRPRAPRQRNRLRHRCRSQWRRRQRRWLPSPCQCRWWPSPRQRRW